MAWPPSRFPCCGKWDEGRAGGDVEGDPRHARRISQAEAGKNELVKLTQTGFKKMIIKEKDSCESAVKELEGILQQNLSSEKRALVERELAALRKGQKGEKDAAYLINFDFGNSENWAVIHDLRLEDNGLVAQIDHLLINRMFDIYVLESKNFADGVKIGDNGEFLAYYNKSYHAIPSPIEQNRRHIRVLKNCLNTHDIMPKRLGISIRPCFRSYILMSAKSRIIRPEKEKFDTSMVIKADVLRTTIDQVVDKMNPITNFTTITKICGSSTLRDVAEKIASLHRPIKMDYAKRFGVDLPRIRSTERSKPVSRERKPYYCWECRSAVSTVVAEYCWSYKHIFDNKVYCKKCQKLVVERRNGKRG